MILLYQIIFVLLIYEFSFCAPEKENENSLWPHDGFSIIASLPSLQPKIEPLYKNSRILNFSIPPVTGLIMSPFFDSVLNAGQHLWVGRVQHSILSIRPKWVPVYGFDDILSAKNCKGIIEDAEKFAKSRIDPNNPKSTGWLTDRHPNHATTDLPVRSIYGDSRLHDYLTDKLLPHFTTIYSVDSSDLYIADLFIVKYTGEASGSGQSFLNSHRDRSPFSFVVSLNDAFSGGGTYFPQLDEIWKPKTGGAVLFHGQSMHGGAKVESGLRYIIAGFVEYNDEFDSDDGAKTLSSGSRFLAFMKEYLAEYDGNAAGYGFRSGDIVRGIEACYINAPDGVLSIDGNVEVSNGKVLPTNNGVSRNLVALDKYAISPQLWSTIASSCEVLEPDANTNLVVERREKLSRSERKLD